MKKFIVLATVLLSGCAVDPNTPPTAFDYFISDVLHTMGEHPLHGHSIGSGEYGHHRER